MSIIQVLKRHYLKLKWAMLNYHLFDFSKKVVHVDEQPLPNVFLGPITYATDCIVTSNNCDFIREPKFAAAYQKALDTNPWEGFTLQWRVYINCFFAKMVKGLNGEFVECGVNTGAYAIAIIDFIDFNSLGKQYYLFDTFEGLVPELVSEEEKKAGIDYYMNGHYGNIYESVKRRFEPYNAKIIKGVVPYSLKQFAHEKICFLSIDMNCVAPEIDAANFFWDRIVPGGVVIVDDYGFAPHIMQKRAFDKFAKERAVDILCLPTGQGVIFKPGRLV